MFALIWWLTEKTGSATVLAMATLFAMLPQIVLGPLVGVYVDRWNRRVTMIVADSLIALASLGLAYLFWSGHVQVWHVYAIMLFREIGGTFHWPAMQSSTTLMVPEQHLARVSGLNQAMLGALNIIGPALGALLLSVGCIYHAMLLDVITAILATTPLYFIAIPQPKRKLNGNAAGEKTSVRADLMEGLRYMLNWRGLMLLTAGIMVCQDRAHSGFFAAAAAGHRSFWRRSGRTGDAGRRVWSGYRPGRAAAGRVGWVQAQHIYITAGDLRDRRGIRADRLPALNYVHRRRRAAFHIGWRRSLDRWAADGDPAENHRAGNAGACIYAVRQPHHADLTHWADHRRAGVGRGWRSGLVSRGRIGGHGVRDLGRSHPCDCQYRGLCLPTARKRRGTAQGSSRPPAPIGTRLALMNFEDRHKWWLTMDSVVQIWS